MNIRVFAILSFLLAIPVCAEKLSMLSLKPNESVSKLSASGDVLAVAVNYREEYQLGKKISELRNDSAIAFYRNNELIEYTPFKNGVIRSVIPLDTGFFVTRVLYDENAHALAEFFLATPCQEVIELPSLEVDPMGAWVDDEEIIYVYSSRAVYYCSKDNMIWKEMKINASVGSEAIRKLITIDTGMSLIATDRVIKVFEDLKNEPVFIKKSGSYPDPIKVFGNSDTWWIVNSCKGLCRINILSPKGDFSEIEGPEGVNIKDILFSEDSAFIVCSRLGGNPHKYGYYIIKKDDFDSMKGPYRLPDDTMIVTLWNDKIVSGGDGNRIWFDEVKE